MTIKRGASWGSPRPLPRSAPVAHSDAELVELAQKGSPGPIGLVGGNLARTLGTTGDQQRLYGPEARTVSLDGLAISIDGAPPRLAVANLVIGSLRRGRFIIISNAAWFGTWNINPRSHPNDGRVEAIDLTTLSIADRVKARRRFRTGTHLPHPDITVSSRQSLTFTWERPRPFRIDEAVRGRGANFAIEVLVDRFSVVI